MYEQLVIQTQMNYSQYYGVYATGGTAVKLTDKKPLPYEEQIQLFAQKIKEADHIIIGGASGLSAAGGGDFYYTDSPSYKKHFAKFYEKYGFKGAFAGMRHHWESREEFWGYLATFLNTTLHAEIRQPYKDLQEILKDKDYFIVTTNQDTQAIKAFPWVRGYGNFLEGTRYQREYQKISDDIENHIQKNDQILFVELGVGRMTPMFIQEPFWALTNNLPNTFDVMVNKEYQFLPEQIENKGVAIKGDITQVLDDVKAAL